MLTHPRSSVRARAWLCTGLLLLSAAPAGAQAFGPVFPGRSWPTPEIDQTRHAELADLDGDGALDLAVLSGPSLVVRLNDHLGGLRTGPAGAFHPLGFGTNDMDLGDLDQDGALDVVISYGNAHGYGVCLGQGDGSFDAPTMVAIGQPSAGIEAADLDGDGLPDLIVALPNNDVLAVGPGQGDGSFGALVQQSSGGQRPDQLLTDDLDLDGDLDLLVGHGDSHDVSVLTNDGAGTLSVSQVLPANTPPGALTLADLDDDAVADLVVLFNGGVVTERVLIAPGLGDGSFDTPSFLPASLGPDMRWDVVAGDLDDNGHVDLVFGGNTQRLFVLFQGGAGFAPALQPYTVGDGPNSLALGDLSGNGLPDLVACASDEPALTVLLSEGGGQFVPPPLVSPGPSQDLTRALDLADMDGDGQLDLGLVRNDVVGHAVAILLGDGTGQFAAPLETPVPGNADLAPDDLLLRDLDDDGLVDACLIDSTGDRVQVLLGQGDGSFGAQLDSPSHFDPSRLAAGDLDGDGLPDLVVAHREADAVSTMLGLGDGSFGAPTVRPTSEEPEDLDLADLDDDGDLDLLLITFTGQDVQVFRGDGAGALFLGQNLVLPNRGSAVRAVDLDQDGAPDLAASMASDTLVFRGLGNGSFVPAAVSIPGGFETVADVDLDGHPDLLGRPSTYAVSVLAGDGQGGLEPAVEHVSAADGLIAVGDLDGDGVPDLVAARTQVQVVLGRLDPLWVDLGQGLAGNLGLPVLRGSGGTTAGAPITLELTFAQPNSSAWMVLGLSQLSQPLKGGVLVPAPDLVLAGLPVGGDGTATIATTWPPGVPAGQPVLVQEWILDPTGPAGLSASNGIRATAW